MPTFIKLNLLNPDKSIASLYINLSQIVSIDTKNHIIYKADGKSDILTGDSMELLTKLLENADEE